MFGDLFFFLPVRIAASKAATCRVRSDKASGVPDRQRYLGTSPSNGFGQTLNNFSPERLQIRRASRQPVFQADSVESICAV